MNGKQRVPPLFLPRTEAAHYVPNALISLLSFLSSSSPPMDSFTVLSATRKGVVFSPLCQTVLIPQHAPPSSPPQDVSVLDSTSSLGTHVLPPSSDSLLSPARCHTSFIPCITYTHNSWIKTKGKQEIPSSCHEQQDKQKTSFPSIPGSLQSSKRRALIDVKSLTT